jgi:integrase
LHDTTITALTAYARCRDLLCPHTQPYFLLSVRGTRLNATIADRTFRSLARAAGVTARPDGTRPLLRSFRHTFAVTTILSWYRDGIDVDAAMPALSAWLGHSNPRDTYWYYSDSRVIPTLALLPA